MKFLNGSFRQEGTFVAIFSYCIPLLGLLAIAALWFFGYLTE